MLALAFTTIVTVVSLIAAAASLAVALGASRKNKPSDEDRQFSGATRGSAIALVIGKTRTPGYVFWQQPDPPVAVTSGNGGKFGSNAGNSTFYEEHFTHILGVNVDKLYSIEEDDEVIFEGPITPLSHPSGTEVNLGDRGTFAIFWGEVDQPLPTQGRDRTFVNAENTDFVRTSGLAGQPFATRCHGVARIDWIPKNLGGRQTHPRMTYTVGGTVRSQLSQSQAHIPEGYDNTIPRLWETAPDDITNAPLGGNTDYSGGRLYFLSYQPTDELAFRVIRAQGGTDPRTRYVDISTGRPFETDLSTSVTITGVVCSPLLTSLFAPGTIIRLQDGTADGGNPANGPYISPAGNGLAGFNGGVVPTGDFEYFYVERVQFFSGNITATNANAPNWTKPANYQAVWQGFVRVWIGPIVDRAALPFFTPVASISASEKFFQALPLVQVADDGVNPAHIIDQIMFAGFPYGAANDRKFYDMESLEEVGRKLQITGEGYRGAIEINDFSSAREAIEAFFEDLGLVITWDPVKNKRVFDLIREPDPADAIQISQDVIVKGEPHTKTLLAKRTHHQLFIFRDQTLNFREKPIVIDDDGSRRIEERADLSKQEIVTTRNPQTAFDVAERRSRAEQVTPLRFDFDGNRGTRDLRTGHILEIEGRTRLYRVLSVKRDPYTDQCRVKAAVDAYGRQVDGVVFPEGRSSRLGNSPQFLGQPGGPEGGSGPTYGAGGGQGVGEPPPGLWRVWEAPAEITPATGKVALLKNRMTPAANGTNVWISGDDVDFRVTVKDPFFQVAGFYGGDGGTPGNVLINVLGPSVDHELLLNISDQEWDAGYQFMVVDDTTTFVRAFTSLGSNNFRVDAADQQAGWGSAALSLDPINDLGKPIFIVRSDRLSLFDDVVLIPGAVAYFKAQNVRRGGSVGRDLADIESLDHTVGLGGKARVDAALISDLADLKASLQGLGLLR